MNVIMDFGKYVCIFLFFLKKIHGVTFQAVGAALPVDTQEFSIECSGESGIGVTFFKETANLGTCVPTPSPDCLLNTGYSFSIDGSNYIFKINTVSGSSCGSYKCKDTGNSQEDIYELTYNKFSSANTSVAPLQPTAGESGALNITTDCLFPASDESITVNWYKTYQDGKVDEALDSRFEIYNETQRSTCADTCGTDTDAKMVIGCRYTPPSNPGTGFQIKVEVIHKAYTDKLSFTFDGTYYDEEPKKKASSAPPIVERTTIVTALLSGYLGWRLC
ncbi:uncharacterized protein LOC128233701 isoform X2 [Mya arenaria]|uniref:uncharacterized protein LOC128233701 isoform X2 n=1 Tax=Mya arenaria TaxID=6604 RepID=UPI0022E1F0EF|nr:uncharacterized protein LOC128233701 isoform X2 [Mya arenaria]